MQQPIPGFEHALDPNDKLCVSTGPDRVFRGAYRIWHATCVNPSLWAMQHASLEAFYD